MTLLTRRYLLVSLLLIFTDLFVSLRVSSDIGSAELMSQQKQEHNFTLSLVAREWNPRVLPDWEFRGAYAE